MTLSVAVGQLMSPINSWSVVRVHASQSRFLSAVGQSVWLSARRPRVRVSQEPPFIPGTRQQPNMDLTVNRESSKRVPFQSLIPGALAAINPPRYLTFYQKSQEGAPFTFSSQGHMQQFPRQSCRSMVRVHLFPQGKVAQWWSDSMVKRVPFNFKAPSVEDGAFLFVC